MTAIVLACGPSLTRADADRCRGHGFVVAVSNAGLDMAPWADVLYSCDAKWWGEHKGAPGFAGRRLSRQPVKDWPAVAVAPDPQRLGSHSTFRKDGGNSGYQALLFAAAEHKRILLLGFDCMDGPGGRKHYFGRHGGKLFNPGPANYERWIKAFNGLAPALAAIGVIVVNCSRATALTCFPRTDLEAAL